MHTMATGSLTILSQETFACSTMLIALTGWMDGGSVSTGTIQGIMNGRELVEMARIEPDPFYIFNFPGPAELAAVFRPEVKYEHGLVAEYEMPVNRFFVDPAAGLVLFSGHEPNLRWQEFSDCILEIARRTGVTKIIFVGSFGGTVPHTRQPRIFAAASMEKLKGPLKELGLRFSEYNGPSGFATMLLWRCGNQAMEMINLVCEIPSYLQGRNPPSIEAVTRLLAKMLNLPTDVAALRRASDDWEVHISQAVQKDSELTETVKKLEERYDNELIGDGEV